MEAGPPLTPPRRSLTRAASWRRSAFAPGQASRAAEYACRNAHERASTMANDARPPWHGCAAAGSERRRSLGRALGFESARPVGARQHVAHAHAHERVEHRLARRGIVGADAGIERAADLGDQAVGFGEAALLQIRFDEPLPRHVAPVDAVTSSGDAGVPASLIAASALAAAAVHSPSRV